MMEDSEYDICQISQEIKFESNKKSPFCPKVGLCGHSFAAQSLRDWSNARKKADYHNKNTKMLPCAFRCTEVVREKGTNVFKEIPAFNTGCLVTNHGLCQAVKEIRDFEKSKKLVKTKPFYQCSLCHQDYSTKSPAKQNGTRSKGAKVKHDPQTAVVLGKCGHTFCLECLQAHQKAKTIKSAAKTGKKNTNTKCLTCPGPRCTKASPFCSDNFVVNFGLKEALRHWETLQAKEPSTAAKGEGVDAAKPPPPKTSRTKRYEKKRTANKAASTSGAGTGPRKRRKQTK